MAALQIMQLADLIPVVMEREEENNQDKEEDEEDQDDEEGDENETQDDVPEETITFEEALLRDVLAREMEEGAGSEVDDDQYDSSTEMWDEIKTTVVDIHEQWSDLEPQIMERGVPQDTIASFEEVLDTLTESSTDENSRATMTDANQLTPYLADFLALYTENSMPTTYRLRHHTRSAVLAAGADDYEEATDDIEKMRKLSEELGEEMQGEDEEEIMEHLYLSLDDMQRGVGKEDLELVKINAAILMGNIVEAAEEMKEQEDEEAQ